MRPSTRLLLLPLYLLWTSAAPAATPIEGQRIGNLSIAGLSLNLPAQAAFDRLLADGYTTDVSHYRDWTEAARSFVRGNPTSLAGGYQEVVLERNGEQLRALFFTSIAPAQPFDTEGEVRRVRQWLGLTEQDPACTLNGNDAQCEVDDTQEQTSYTLQLIGGHQRHEAATRRYMPAAGL
ncbi:MAG: hypothetical protein AAGA91_14135 [Pseudomonadota bacterium]